jgi:hypothetical protein
MKTRIISLLLALCFSVVMPLFAQESVTVPSVVGLNVPQAAAELNRAGLRLGTQNAVAWDGASDLSVNTVSTQAIAAGSSATPGSVIDVEVLRSPNIAISYDDNDLIAINLTADSINITGLTFSAIGGTTASFAASRWAGTLDAGDCGQIWSISRNAPKDVEGCDSTHWLTTNKPQEHFWTAVNGVVSFSILDNSLERAICDAAPPSSQNQPLRCEAYIAGSDASTEVTPYIYYAYTTQTFAVINHSPDKWMPTGPTTILNYNPAIANPRAPVDVSDPKLYKDQTLVADIARLAPGQCLLLTSDSPTAAPPESCDLIAHRNLTSSVAFWLANFRIDSATDDDMRQCPAAVPDKTTICVLPR